MPSPSERADAPSPPPTLPPDLHRKSDDLLLGRNAVYYWDRLLHSIYYESV